MKSGDLEKLGFDAQVEKLSPHPLRPGCSLARVTEVNKNRFTVSDGAWEMPAELTGKFFFQADEATDFPTVGDWVVVNITRDPPSALIHSILPRKTLLRRKESGRRIQMQLIASNIDFGLILQSADHLNPNLLDRYLVMLHESAIVPIVIISKTDLVSPEELEEIRDSLAGTGYATLLISNKVKGGTQEVKDRLIPGKTYCLLGQSGVGKSSLLNSLMDSSLLEVGAVRAKDGRGRHTTVRRQLVCLDSGSIFIDTPGIRELGNFQVDSGLELTFDDLASLSQACRFADCSHTHEHGCAIIEAVENGEIGEDRYQNFLKLRRESEFYDLSYQERRKKNKAFGKMVNNYKKRKGKGL